MIFISFSLNFIEVLTFFFKERKINHELKLCYFGYPANKRFNQEYMKLKITKSMMLGTLLSTGVVSMAQDSTVVDDLDFLDMDLEALMQVEVTSVSKKAERLQDVPVSLYVLTNDDIMRSGATNLHEVLMQVPGYWGTQNSYSDVEPGMRFSPVANGAIGSILFLLDGTPIQELISAGLSWENFDLPLEDIDRIEVIRGSGGTIYGANSATGVVNIFTKDADKYDGVIVRAEGATPTLGSFSVSGGKKIGDFSIGAYGKVRYFGGYNSLSEFEGDEVTVPRVSGGDTTITNRFTENYEEMMHVSFGLKAKYDISEASKISTKIHFNTHKQGDYTNSFIPETYNTVDVLKYNENQLSRLVANVRFDQEFSENHSLFVRASTNAEEDFYAVGGGYKASNNIIDFEAQDNITIGINSINIGANFRLVNFDLHDINNVNSIGYLDPQANENLWGVFAQDKLAFLDGKLNLILGIKAEQFSLASNKPYFSPQAKFSFIPSDKITIWGGYSKAYTTPGFNQTNIELILAQLPNVVTFDDFVGPVSEGVYQGVYAGAKEKGATDEGANKAAADYVASEEGQGDIATRTLAAIESTYPTYYNQAVKNGSNTKPTSFTNLELGIRSSGIKNLLLDGNFFYTIIKDAVGASAGVVLNAQPMESENLKNFVSDLIFYGNYFEGTSVGFEANIKYMPIKGLLFEASYVNMSSEFRYQDNDDFETTDEVIEEDMPSVPKNIFRLRTKINLPGNMVFSASGLFTSKYNSEGQYEYENQRYESVLGGDLGVVIAPAKTRQIVNLRLEKAMMEDKLSVYVFANDITNSGRIEQTSSIATQTLVGTRSMYGLGAIMKF